MTQHVLIGYPMVRHNSHATEWLSMGLSSSRSGSNKTSGTAWERYKKPAIFAAVLVVIVLAVALPVGLSLRAGRAGVSVQQWQRLDTSGMILTFQDDFAVSKGLNASTWRYDLGDGSIYGIPGFGNGELQCYTSSPDNVDIIPNPSLAAPTDDADGVLRIRSRKLQIAHPCINPGVANGSTQWTSGKIDTKGKLLLQWKPPQVSTSLGAAVGGSGSSTASEACGSIVVEARMMVPFSAGRWSALWLMPEPQPGRFPGCLPWVPGQGECGAYGGWPRSGELDIMEHVNTASKVLGTMHYAGYGGEHQSLGDSTTMDQDALSNSFAVYQLHWSCNAITWFVNGQQMYSVLRDQVKPVWPFDEPFFLILNTAVGGALTGYAAPDPEDAAMLVDYVRVYASGA